MRTFPRRLSSTTRGVFEVGLVAERGYSKLSPNMSIPPIEILVRGHQFENPCTACTLMPKRQRKITRTHSPPETPRAGSGCDVAAQYTISARRKVPQAISRKGQYLAR